MRANTLAEEFSSVGYTTCAFVDEYSLLACTGVLQGFEHLIQDSGLALVKIALSHIALHIGKSSFFGLIEIDAGKCGGAAGVEKALDKLDFHNLEIVDRTDDFLKAVVERTEIVKEGLQIYYTDGADRIHLSGEELVSMNIWGFTPAIFDQLENSFTGFIRDNAGDIKAELYIPKVVNDLVSQNSATVRIIPASDQWFGVTYKEDKPLAVENIRRLIAAGVYPDRLWK